FNVILGLSPSAAILLAGGIVVLYCVVGGMWSITLTDILQFIIMTIGIFFVLLPLAISRAGGFSGMRDTLPASYFDITAIGGGTIFAYFLLFFFGIMIGQDIWQRVFTARNSVVARWGGVAAGVYCLLYAVAGALIGSAAKVILPNLATPDNAFAEVTKAALPVGLTGLVLAAALAAVMSTASATLLAASTILANDLYASFFGGGDRVRLSRIFTLLVGGVVLVLSLLVKDVVGALTVAYDLLSGALFVPILGALFWSRATGTGALVAMAVSSVVVVVLMIVLGLFSNWPIIAGMLVSFVLFVGVSLLTRPTSEREAAAWDRRVRGTA
ncbi:MAG: sodium:solute symporter, partial [Rubrobacteraceae bacterium]|nr:sodium:solute symporter [Rubrobacteraceae bacterium]